jgi:hypothetical protein
VVVAVVVVVVVVVVVERGGAAKRGKAVVVERRRRRRSGDIVVVKVKGEGEQVERGGQQAREASGQVAGGLRGGGRPRLLEDAVHPDPTIFIKKRKKISTTIFFFS